MSSGAIAKLRDRSDRVSQDRAAIAVARPSTTQIEMVTTVAGLLKLESAWRKLELHNTTVFQSFDWVKTWCDVYLGSAAAGEILIVTGQQGGTTVFILPLIKSKKHGLNILDWLTDPIGQYGDALCASSQNSEFWLKAAFDKLSEIKGIDLVRLRHVRDTGAIANFARHHLHDAKYYERAPYLDLSAFANDTDYDARYSSTQRKRRKKIRKSLEDLGDVSFSTLNSGADADRAIDQSIAEKNAWLSDRGRFNRIMGCPNHVTFLKNLSRVTTPDFKMMTTELKAGDKPISWEIGFRYQGTHFAYITSHVNALTDLSPGRLHMDLSQRLAIADQQSTFDLMVPHDLHKESWSSGTIPTNDYFKPLTFLGALYGHGYLATVRPLLRKLYYKLPPNILRMIQPITRH